jgi:hypothetical protein
LRYEPGGSGVRISPGAPINHFRSRYLVAPHRPAKRRSQVVAGLSTTWSFPRYSDPSSRRPQRFRCSKSGGQVKTNRIAHRALAYATRRSTRLLHHAVGRCKSRRSPMVRCARRQSRNLRRATQPLTGDFGVRGLSARRYVKCSLTAGAWHRHLWSRAQQHLPPQCGCF